MSKSLSLLTSPDAVKEAVTECDQLGREAFLKKYGYKYSRLYLLHYNQNVYDSKAIAGVAFGKQHGAPLRANEFSGGAATVVPVFEKLGFSVQKAIHPATYLAIGKTYFRKALVELFGGQLQSGIWTPREFPVIFIFSGDSGKTYGYKDGWTDNGIFQYTGEGQTGNMTFTGGNRAIRDHRQDGKDLLLFKDLGKGKGVRYEGLFECASWQEVNGLDKDQQKRQIIVFNLVPVTTVASGSEMVELNTAISLHLPLEELRQAAYRASNIAKTQVKTSDAKQSWYERSETVRTYVLARASGICEACDQAAPFVRKDGTPYLEPHHTKRLADNGPDHPAWVGAICPNCHRRIHSGEDGDSWNKQLQARLKSKEPLA